MVRPGAFAGAAPTGRDAESPPFAHVLVIGAGLVGTSLGLALRRQGVAVGFEDADPNHLRIAVSVGAGVAGPTSSSPDLVVVAVPPMAVCEVVADALRRFPQATVTDVGSVKETALASVSAPAVDLERYVGSHPMAGSEQSGPLAAQADLFDGRAWAVTPHPHARPESVAQVELLAQTCHAVPIRLTPAEHDEAVALVSHLPHVTSSVVASLLASAPDGQLQLAGQGLRDVTRVAAGDPRLWTQILSANAVPVAQLLRDAATRLNEFAGTLEGATEDELQRTLERGVSGVRRLPGKHGARPEEFAQVPVLLADRPGELARLFADVEAAGVNIEDVRIDHSPATPAGLVELAVRTSVEAKLLEVLADRGWVVHG